MGRDAADVAGGRFQRRAGETRGSLVLEPDVQDAGHRESAAAKDLEPLAAGHAVGDQNRAALHRADLDRAPRELLDQPDRLARTDDVPDLDGALERERQSRKEIAEGFLERQAQDGRNDGRRGQQQRQVRREDELGESPQEQPEDEQIDELTEQRGGAAPRGAAGTPGRRGRTRAGA